MLGRWRKELKNDGVEEETVLDGRRAVGLVVAGGDKRVGIPDVRLSNDAGRFLCEFTFYESLSQRWKEAREEQRRRRQQRRKGPHQRLLDSQSEAFRIADFEPGASQREKRREGGEEEEEENDDDGEEDEGTILELEEEQAASREGKVAFLHVPGDTDAAAIERGVRVTEAAIRAIVASWEEGYRRNGRIMPPQTERRVQGRA